jgi:hypothetical protein
LLPSAFLEELKLALLSGGWVLCDAGRFYGFVKVGTVDGWPRLSSRRIEDELGRVAKGTFNFEDLDGLWPSLAEDDDDDGGTA